MGPLISAVCKCHVSVSLSGDDDDVGAMSVDSMVLVMAGLMLALLIVLLVVALFLHRRHQVDTMNYYLL